MTYESGYYWCYRKGSPVPDIAYVHDGKVYDIWHTTTKRTHGPDEETLELDYEFIEDGKWRIGEKVVHPLDNTSNT